MLARLSTNAGVIVAWPRIVSLPTVIDPGLVTTHDHEAGKLLKLHEVIVTVEVMPVPDKVWLAAGVPRIA